MTSISNENTGDDSVLWGSFSKDNNGRRVFCEEQVVVGALGETLAALLEQQTLMRKELSELRDSLRPLLAASTSKEIELTVVEEEQIKIDEQGPNENDLQVKEEKPAGQPASESNTPPTSDDAMEPESSDTNVKKREFGSVIEQKKWNLSVSYWVKRDEFEAFIAFAIFLNAMIICFEVQYGGLELGYDIGYPGCTQDAKSIWPLAKSVFIAFDWLFGLVFLAEMILKIYAYHLKYFKDPWSWLDMVCVLQFLVEQVASSFSAESSTIKQLRILRMVRLLRLLRLARRMSSLDGVHIMIASIKGMVAVFLSAMILLTLTLMVCSLIIGPLLSHTYFKGVDRSNKSEEELINYRRVYEYFGTFSRCMLSMFELTLADWPPGTRLLVEEVSEYWSPVCLFFKLTVGFALVAVINGVLLQETFKNAQEDDTVMVRQHEKNTMKIKNKMTALINTLFVAKDADEDGEVGLEEFKAILEVPEINSWFSAMEIATDDAEALFALIDTDGDGSLTPEEVAGRIPQLKGTARCCDVLSLAKRFDKKFGAR